SVGTGGRPRWRVGALASDASVRSPASGLASTADRRSVPIANEPRLVLPDRFGTPSSHNTIRLAHDHPQGTGGRQPARAGAARRYEADHRDPTQGSLCSAPASWSAPGRLASWRQQPAAGADALRPNVSAADVPERSLARRTMLLWAVKAWSDISWLDVVGGREKGFEPRVLGLR